MAKKAANGEGSFTKLSSGNWRYRVTADIDGVRISKSFTASSKTQCRERYKKWLASSNKVPIERVQTVEQWAEHWLELYCKPKVSYPTYTGYQGYIKNHIVPIIGSMKLTDVKPAHVSTLVQEKLNRKTKEGKPNPMSRSAINDIVKVVLSGIFETAIENNLALRNPTKSIALPQEPESDIVVFTPSQMQSILDYMPEHECGYYVALLLYTGCRLGELIGLMWADINTQEQTICIRRSLKDTKKGYQVTDSTKTKRNRIITYDDTLGVYLDKIPRSGLYVLSRNFKGTPTHHTKGSFYVQYYRFFDDLNKKIEKEVKQTGEKLELIPRLSPHKCRHTFATYLLKSTNNLRVVQEILGHSSVTTTEIYTHVNTDDMRQNVKKLSFK